MDTQNKIIYIIKSDPVTHYRNHFFYSNSDEKLHTDGRTNEYTYFSLVSTFEF